MIKKNGLLLLALLVAPSLAAMKKGREEDSTEKHNQVISESFDVGSMQSKQPHIPAIKVELSYLKSSLRNHGYSSDFGKKLYAALKNNKVEAVEPDGIRILSRVATLDSKNAKNFLNQLPVEEVPYLITAMAIAKLMNDKTSIALLNEAFAFHKEKIGTMKGKDVQFSEKFCSRVRYIPYKYQGITVRQNDSSERDLYDLGNDLKLASIGSVPTEDYQPYFDLLPYRLKKLNHKDFENMLKKSEKNEIKNQNDFDHYKRKMYAKYKKYLNYSLFDVLIANLLKLLVDY